MGIVAGSGLAAGLFNFLFNLFSDNPLVTDFLQFLFQLLQPQY